MQSYWFWGIVIAIILLSFIKSKKAKKDHRRYSHDNSGAGWFSDGDFGGDGGGDGGGGD